jgi:hypothetical protein
MSSRLTELGHLPHTLVGFAFVRSLAQQDALDGLRHFVASFFPRDAIDEGFGAGRLSAVHKAPPGKSYAQSQRRTKRDRLTRRSV